MDFNLPGDIYSQEIIPSVCQDFKEYLSCSYTFNDGCIKITVIVYEKYFSDQKEIIHSFLNYYLDKSIQESVVNGQ
ncbi:hypothetical protein CWS43_13805 [Rahnella sp. AA]|nr:hypothetical protein CWS43_13805 [Rahnella sp. AA]